MNKTEQNLQNAINFSTQTGNYTKTDLGLGYDGNSGSTDAVDHSSVVEVNPGLNLQITDNNAIKVNGDTKAEVSYGYELYKNFDIDGDIVTDSIDGSVTIDRAAVHPKNGEVELGAITKLTGKRAERAKQILNDRVARTIGSSAVERVEQLKDKYQQTS